MLLCEDVAIQSLWDDIYISFNVRLPTRGAVVAFAPVIVRVRRHEVYACSQPKLVRGIRDVKFVRLSRFIGFDSAILRIMVSKIVNAK